VKDTSGINSDHHDQSVRETDALRKDSSTGDSISLDRSNSINDLNSFHDTQTLNSTLYIYDDTASMTYDSSTINTSVDSAPVKDTSGINSDCHDQSVQETDAMRKDSSTGDSISLDRSNSINDLNSFHDKQTLNSTLYTYDHRVIYIWKYMYIYIYI
jgi:hypothetical protein